MVGPGTAVTGEVRQAEENGLEYVCFRLFYAVLTSACIAHEQNLKTEIVTDNM